MPNLSSSPTPLPKLHTIKDVAAALRLSDKTVRRLIESGELIAHQLGRQWRITGTDFDAFLKLRRKP